MLDSPPLPTIDNISAPAVSAQLVGLFAELIQGYSYLGNQLRSDVNVLKSRLDSLEGVRATSEPKVQAEPKNLEITPLLGAHRQFLQAIVRGDIDIVKSTLKHIPSLALRRHANGWFPIHAAVLTGNLDIVKAVFGECEREGLTYKDEWEYDSDSPTPDEFDIREKELGAKAKTIKTKDCTALHFACRVGKLDVIKYLIENGANFEAEDYAGRKPQEYFDVIQHADVLSEYRNMERDWINRDWEFRQTSFDDCKTALRERNLYWFKKQLLPNPNYLKEWSYYDFQLLHMAAIHQLPEFVKVILDVDKSIVNVKDSRSNDSSDASHDSFSNNQFPHRYVKDATPLHYACLTGNLEIIEMLLKAGADWTLTDWRDRTPEQVIFDNDGEMMEVKEAFIKLRDEEDARRKGETGEATPRESGDTEGKKVDGDGEGSKADGNAEGQTKEDDSQSDKSDDKSEKSEDDSDSSSSSDEEETKNVKKLTKPLEVVLGDRVIGQRGPIRCVSSAIRLRENGWVDPDRPLVMLFLGSSGVGKTELAKQVALYLQGKESTSTQQSELVNEMEQECAFIRIDMSEYQHSHTVANLTGSPKGYVGYDEGGGLTSQLRKNPKAVVLIDEIEKAHPDVLTVFLQVFDDGRITDPKNGVVYCKDAVFIMTSNLATEQIKRQSPFLRKLVAETEAQGRPEEYIRVMNQFNRDIYPQLKARLRRDEFLGRINQTVVFLPLNEEEIATVINKELDVWRRRAEEKHSIKLSWSREAVAKLTKSYDVNFGVRSVMHEVQRIAVQLIADAHIRGELKKDWFAYLTVNELGDVVLQSGNPSEVVKIKRGCKLFLY